MYARTVSGAKMATTMAAPTLEAVRAMTPKKAKSQLMALEQTMTRMPAMITSPRPPAGRSIHMNIPVDSICERRYNQRDQ